MREHKYECASCNQFDISKQELQVMYAHERHNESPEEYGEGAFELLKMCPSGKHVLERSHD